MAQDIYQMLSTRLEEAKVAEVMVPNEVQIVDAPTLPEKAIAPRKVLIFCLLYTSLGINPTMIISITVMIASALGAAAGVLVGLSFNAIEPTMGVIIGFKGLAVLILGGLGNITGAMVGGFILGVAEIFSVAYGASTFRDAVAFGLIILLLFWRPQGLFGSKDKGGRP